MELERGGVEWLGSTMEFEFCWFPLELPRLNRRLSVLELSPLGRILSWPSSPLPLPLPLPSSQ